MPVGEGAGGLVRGDDLDREIALARGDPDRRGDGAGGDTREFIEQGAVVEEAGPDELGHSEHHLPVRDECEKGLLEPETPQRQAFGVTNRAEAAALAEKRTGRTRA